MLDEGVPNSVGQKLEESGHNVIYMNRAEVVVRGSPDPLVAQAAAANGAILVALDGDMKKIAGSYGLGQNRYRKLSLLKLSCFEPNAVIRVDSFMSLIEHEWLVSSSDDSGRRLHMEILDTLVRIMR